MLKNQRPRLKISPKFHLQNYLVVLTCIQTLPTITYEGRSKKLRDMTIKITASDANYCQATQNGSPDVIVFYNSCLFIYFSVIQQVSIHLCKFFARLLMALKQNFYICPSSQAYIRLESFIHCLDSRERKYLFYPCIDLKSFLV